MINKILLWDNNCRVTNGIKYSIIINLISEEYVRIESNLLTEIDFLIKNRIINPLLNADTNTINIITELLNYNYLHWIDADISDYITTNNDDEFYESNAQNDMIIDIGKESLHNPFIILELINSKPIYYLQIRYYYNILDTNYIEKLLKALNRSNVKYIEILHPYSKKIDVPKTHNLVKNNEIILALILYNTPLGNKDDIYKSDQEIFSITYSSDDIMDETSCGKISTESFVVNHKFYRFSKQFNNCLKNKISIDRFGQIKNCPSCKENFGSISDTKNFIKIFDLMLESKLSSIIKDEISICKSCEYRYICSDCRVYLSNEADVYSKPLKCGYDPASGNWDESD